MVVDGDADVVFLDELFDARQRRRRGIAGDDHADARAFAVLEFGANVVVFVFGEVDGAGRVQPDAGGGIVGQRLAFLPARSAGR